MKNKIIVLIFCICIIVLISFLASTICFNLKSKNNVADSENVLNISITEHPLSDASGKSEIIFEEIPNSSE